MRTILRFWTGVSLALSLVQMKGAGGGSTLEPGSRTILAGITAAELKGDLSFLSSDALQGRYTPSPGLNVAAEFIASKFRAAGLEPGGDQEYFQTAPMVDRRMPDARSALIIERDGETITVPAGELRITEAVKPATIEHAGVIFVAAKDAALLKGLELASKAVIVPQPNLDKVTGAERRTLFLKVRAFDAAVAASQAVLEVTVASKLSPPSSPRLLRMEQAEEQRAPGVMAASEELLKIATKATREAGQYKLSFELPGPQDSRVEVKNVIGVLRGSDPALKETCVLLTAHYDHIGTTETAGRMALSAPVPGGDHIYNGANDDGSGTVSVIEIARALAKLPAHPKRSIVFMTFFGEERGELGSQYYGRHPLFPINKTVADINLEQVGRSDSSVGKQLNNASLTGYDYSDVTGFFERAGRRLGIKVYKDKEASDAYFTRSDNAALAEQGVPAHTLTVAFDYADYHGLGDEWQKVDYENMAKVDRMVALGLLDIANSVKAPAWNAANPKTQPFREAWKKSRQP
jgi:hypothetical protein